MRIPILIEMFFMSCQSNSILDYPGSFHKIIKWRVARARFNASSSSQEADTDDQQGTLTYEEFSVFYKMMSLRRDVFLLMMAYSDRKDHLTADELVNFLRNEQKVRARAGTQPFLLIPPLVSSLPIETFAVASSRGIIS